MLRQPLAAFKLCLTFETAWPRGEPGIGAIPRPFWPTRLTGILGVLDHSDFGMKRYVKWRGEESGCGCRYSVGKSSECYGR